MQVMPLTQIIEMPALFRHVAITVVEVHLHQTCLLEESNIPA